VAPTVHIRLAGSFTVSRADVRISPGELGSRQARTLLKLLCVERGRLVDVDRISTVLWNGQSRPRAAENVATLVSRLRRTLDVSVITGARGGYRLGPVVEVDLDVAARLTDEAEHRLPAEPGLAAVAASSAIDLLGTETVLADEPYSDWAEPARTERITLLRRARHTAARAALDSGDPATAAGIAQAAVDGDRLDEPAYRNLMAAYQETGEPAAAIATYQQLRTLLADELGIDPAPETRALYSAILREERPTRASAKPSTAPRLAGRAGELARLQAAWEDTAHAQGDNAVLVIGEAGIGKTRLTEEFARVVRQTGGTILPARCYETERSLLFQPIVETLTPLISRMPAATVRELAANHAGALADVVPGVAPILGTPPQQHSPIEIRRRRAFEAVTAFLVRLSRRGPIALLIDDLHHAGRSTVELLHYLIRHTGDSRLLVVATARTEAGDEVRAALADVAKEIELGPLTREAVAELATSAGHTAMVDPILTRTSGHTLFVVETLRALAAGSSGLPASLQAAVLDRVRPLGAENDELLRAAAVLGSAFDPATLAALLGITVPTAVSRCERALAARLVVVAGREYEFAHDLVREVLYANTPAPTRVAYHRRAADLLTDRPEAVGAHAAAAGDVQRAGRAWLLAAENAMHRLAAADAETLASRAIEIGEPETRARALVIRGRAREARAIYQSAVDDLQTAVELARESGDRRLEMVALRQLGGDAPVAAGRPAPSQVGYLEQGLRLAESLADRTMEADILDRLAVLSSNQLRLAEAVSLGRRALTAAHACVDDKRALALALDAIKTPYSFLGEAGQLSPVVTELETLLRGQHDLWMLQWTVFESAFVPLAAGDYGRAADRIDAAIGISRRSGTVSYETWFLAHRAWSDRLRGDLRAAIEHGRRAVDRGGDLSHSWWQSASLSMLATTFLEIGEPAEAIALLERARPMAERGGTKSYLLRCVAPLALATGSAELLAEADDLLGQIDAPPGSAWVLGADAYMCVAKAWLNRGDAERARAILDPLIYAVRRIPWRPLLTPINELVSTAMELQSPD
jgi:DNA-binding SARP family transcriptional activator/tetratricopeptide (TPR) repeat protein